MNTAMKLLHRSLLLGSCVLLAGSALLAQGPPAGTIVEDITGIEPQVLSTPTIGNLPADSLHLGPASQPLSAPLSIPLGVYPLDAACARILHSRNGILNSNLIADEVGIFPEFAIPGADAPYQHPAPEAVLQFSAACTDKAFANWKLSSRDAPRSRPAIPHGPLVITVRIDVQPVDFVELIFDGVPLKPTAYSTVSPLRYELPCPAAGPHALQVRFLSGNIWSYYSQALRFEVRLPAQPRIIAASDFDRDPTPLARHGLTSITTTSIKVHLANVDRGDSIVAYIDGKPVTSHLTEQSCCRIIKVEGLITAGVHKLTVRTVGCSGSCSITSQPSNTVMFHYYDEDVYLFRPGAGCGNKRPSKDCPPVLHSTSGLLPARRSEPIGQTQQDLGVIGRPKSSVEAGDLQPNPSVAKAMDRGAAQDIESASVFQFVSFLQVSSAVDTQLQAAQAYAATKKTLDTTPVAIVGLAQDDVKRSQESVRDAETSVKNAESHYRTAHGLLKDAAMALKRTHHSADQAHRESARAAAYAKAEAICGDEARARVARDRSNLAAQHARLTSDQVGLAEQDYSHVEAVVADAYAAVDQARSHLASAKSFRDLAQKEVDQLVAARAVIVQAEQKAREAYNREPALRKGQDFAGALLAVEEVLKAQGIADDRSQDVVAHARQAKQYADWTTDRESDARAAAQRARDAADRADTFTTAANKVAFHAAQLAAAATSNAQHAGRVLEMDAATERALDEAEEKAAYEAAGARFNAAKASPHKDGVMRAQESAEAAQARAAQEWQKAIARIAEGQASTDAARAAAVVGPSSPFVFATAAHFPIREFGLRGKPLDREGIVIYEDMALHFDRDGNYEVHFRATAPQMPVTIRLQFQIQPNPGRPWYTITLAPIEFPYPPAKDEQVASLRSSCSKNGSSCRDDQECCGEVRSCFCKGHSEILRRCYGEMGQDARIRRSGTARFGFGVDVP